MSRLHQRSPEKYQTTLPLCSSTDLHSRGWWHQHMLDMQFMWTPNQARGRWLPLTTPLAIPAFFLSDPYATKLLAVIAIVMAAVQFGLTRFTQQQGNKVI